MPPDLRNLVYAFDRSFEMAIAAMAAPLVGILAQHVFGFAVRLGLCLAQSPRLKLALDRTHGLQIRALRH